MVSAEVNRTAIGVVRKPHGIRGGLKVTLYSIDLDMLQVLEQLFVRTGDNWNSLTLQSAQGHEEHTILSFKEITDRTAAEAFRGQELYTLRDALPELDEDEYYIDDLIGCEVFDDADAPLGLVTEILTPGAHEVLVVGSDEDEMLVPLVKEWVSSIDISERKIWIHLPEDVT